MLAFLRRMRRWLVAMSALSAVTAVAQDEEFTFGILAYRPIEQVEAQWAPLASALNASIPGRTFKIEIGTLEQLNEAVHSRRLDFVLTNSAQYIQMTKRSGLSAPLASLVNEFEGHPISEYGGVIFQRQDHAAIRHLGELRGH
jgi:ABC-type phosphate/phosphonate transport system substrate-binding protein